MKKFLLIVILCLAFNGVMAQNKSYWSAHTSNQSIIKNKAVSRLSFPKTFKLFDLNFQDLSQDLYAIAENRTAHTVVITIPNAQGELEEFEMVEASNFEPALQSRFPEIRAYSGKGITDKYATIKLSLSPQGIQTMVFRADKENEFMEPYSSENNIYAVFNSQRTAGQLPWTCSTVDRQLADGLNSQVSNAGITARSGGDLKTMRLAQSVTAEYSNYFGATSSAQVSLVLAGINATLTRCNGVYEKDLALHLNLISNTTSVIYYNASTDPYDAATTGAGGTWNAQLQSTLTSVIGEANYDIGHLFGASGGGGNAGCIGCICTNNQKGSGFTSPADGIPQGDNFDIDYVVHEIGHQLGANHTFSMSNEGTGVNKEVGSGITIMGYAGITSQDVAPHSIDIYHQASIAQIQANLLTKTCPVTTSISANNATPVLAAVSNFTIPISTPFALTGSATDANGDALTYCWEQNDNASASQTNASSVASATKSTGPNWISFSPSTSPTRYFPKLATILAGATLSGPLTGGDAGANTEALSSVARTLNFRLTVRDNSPYSSTAPVKVGQTQFTDMVVTVSATSGPFTVTSPNTAVSWAGGSTQNITWNVASTTASPVSCANVKISLSTDGGLTFPTVLSASTPNDGTESIVLPSVTSTTARIKIEAVGNIFFDISNTNFTLTTPVLCGDPTGLTSSAITNNTANLSWTAVANALNYSVDYKLSSSATWVNLSTAQTTTTASLSGLTQGSVYNWRVRATCSAGAGNYVSAQFTTTAPCDVTTGLTSSNISYSSATIGWTAVTGAVSYNIQYRVVGNASWLSTTSTTNTKSLTSLSASSNYEFQVQTVCASGSSAFSSAANFTTTAAPACSNNFEPNNTLATATALTANTAVTSQISSASDVDWYSFTTTSPNTNVKVALSGLPVDYDLSLYNAALTLLGSSANTGTTAEQVISNTTTAGTYYVKVAGFNGVSLANYNFSAGTAAAASTSTKITASVVSQGNNNGTTTLITNSSASSTYTGASGTYNAGVAARTGALNTATSGSAYFQLTLTPTAGNAISLTGISFGSRSTATGPVAYAIRSSLDNYASNIATGTLTANSSWLLASASGITLSGGTGTAVTLRIYGFNGTGSAAANTANWRIDDITITGSSNAFDAVNCYTLLASTGSTTFKNGLIAKVGISQINGIYPNPAHNEIRINSMSDISANSNVTILDSKGIIVKRQKINNSNQQINIADLPTGIYLLRFINGNNVRTEKFIKQ
jgi:hypothetical protein